MLLISTMALIWDLGSLAYDIEVTNWGVISLICLINYSACWLTYYIGG